jgi:hypothetical protein
MAVSFITTRVNAPDEDDWGKLVRVLKYINGTRYMKLILSADEMNFTVHWYVGGSHQCHEDCRGQIGCLMTMKGSCDQFIEYNEMQHIKLYRNGDHISAQQTA